MVDPEPPRDASLNWLKWLVIVLTVVMIGGLLTLVSLAVMTFRGETTPLQIPMEVTVPEGQRVLAVTAGSDWTAVVTTNDDGAERIHILDPATGEIRQTVDIE